MKLEVVLEGREVLLDVERTATGWRVRPDGGDWSDVPGRFVQAGELRLTHGGRTRTVGVHVDGDRVALQVDGHPLFAEVFDPRRAHALAGGGAGEGAVSTPMPGVVVRIPVKAGDPVRAGQVLIVVEAMKMENEFKAPVDGVVGSIPVAVGQAVDAHTVLVVVQPA